MEPKEFYKQFQTPSIEREEALIHEIQNGNVPNWTHKFVTIAPGVEVAVDYLAIGQDDDFCRCPMTPWAAQIVANKFGYQLPTPMLVELIYKAAEHKLPPMPEPWYRGTGSAMRLGSNYLAHNAAINFSQSRTPGLVAGHKKDVVSDAGLLKKHPRHVLIYGWNTSAGHPIQGEQWVHDWMYEDYSHGIRFVKCVNPILSGPCSLDKPPVG